MDRRTLLSGKLLQHKLLQQTDECRNMVNLSGQNLQILTMQYCHNVLSWQ